MTLIRHRIETLRLREDAPFPSECEDAQQMIREWRHERLVRCLDRIVDRPEPDFGDMAMVGDEE